MGGKLLLAAATLAIAAPAMADTVYSNDFDGENGGATALNYTGFTGLTVSDGQGSVRLNARTPALVATQWRAGIQAAATEQ